MTFDAKNTIAKISCVFFLLARENEIDSSKDQQEPLGLVVFGIAEEQTSDITCF